MADLDFTGNDSGLKFESRANLNTAIDEDLIDYDSDDAFVTQSASNHILSLVDKQTFDTEELVDTTTTAAQDASEAMNPSEGAATQPAATSMGDGQSDQHTPDVPSGPRPDDEILDEIALEGESTSEQTFARASADLAPATAGADQSRTSFHEIDYEDDGFSFDASAGHDNQKPLDSSPNTIQGVDAPNLQTSESGTAEPRAKRYEIDWEDDEEQSPAYGAQDGTVGGGTESSVADAYDEKIGEQDAEVMQERLDADDVAAQAPAQPEPFPSITVHYRGEEFPMFSHTSDGFFSDVSVLDGNMKTVLDGLREELADEIGPYDDLVLQVDKLGLEFSESSPSDALSLINLRQMLEILDILVKNTDFDNSRILYMYLFTRPNTMRRYEYLVESATGDKGLAEVSHLFHPPAVQDVYEEQNTSNEDTGNDDASAETGQDTSDADLVGEGEDHSRDYQGEHEEDVDRGSVDPGTDDEASAEDDQVTDYAGPDVPDAGSGHGGATMEPDIGDANDDGRGDVSQLFDNGLAAMDDDEDFLDTITGEDQNSHHGLKDSGGNRGKFGVDRVFDPRLDPDLIDYSSAGDKNAGEDDDLSIQPPRTVGDEALDDGVDADAAIDDDLIDYEGIGGDDEGAQYEVGHLAETSGEASAYVVHGHDEGDADLVEYGADESGDGHIAVDASLDFETGAGDQVRVDDDSKLGESLASAGDSSHTAGYAQAHGDGEIERLLDDDWENPEEQAPADGNALAHSGPDMAGMADPGTMAMANVDAMLASHDAAKGSSSSGDHAEAAVSAGPDNRVGDALDAPNVMKRAYSEGDEDEGSDVKRRRS